MTKAQHTALEPVSHILDTALHSNFARVSPSDWKTLMASYEDLYGKALTQSERNCSTCRLRAIKRLAKDYFDYKPRTIKTNTASKGTEPSLSQSPEGR